MKYFDDFFEITKTNAYLYLYTIIYAFEQNINNHAPVSTNH